MRSIAMVRSLPELEEYRDCERRVMKIRSAYLEIREPFRPSFHWDVDRRRNNSKLSGMSSLKYDRLVGRQHLRAS